MAGPHGVQFIAIFDTLYISGLVSLTAIVLTAWLSPTIQRSSSWFIFIWSWLLASFANIIIVGQQTGPEPMTGVCLFQAMLVYGLPVLNSLSGTAFTLQAYLSIQGAIEGSSAPTRKQLIAIHTIPILGCLCVFVEVLVMGLSSPKSITRDATGMYCHLASPLPSRITAGITMLAMTCFLVVGFKLFRIIRRRQEALIMIQGPGARGCLSRDVLTRFLIFGCCPLIALAISSVQYISSSYGTDVGTNLVVAILPLVASFIFGSQRDMLYTWKRLLPGREQDPANVEIKPATA